ncbi:uncharacterized protein LOC141904460 [Tubulanus polymorphus]|uniref:uncharacterized protein LOC141904460 n=1 Tax=Tubulanus polymorphus TaxID=672921 RepID=UPI003DA33CD4
MEEENERKTALIDGKENTRCEERPTFEDVFKEVGESGPFQWLVFLGFCVLEAAGSSILMFFILDGANPGWNCPGNVGNYSSYDGANFTVNQTVQPSLLKGVCYQGKPCTNFTFNEDYTSTITEWTLICDRSIISKSITSIFFIGVVIGSLLTGQMSDLFGRKRALLVVWALAMIGQISSSFSPNWGVYVALRFLTGFAAGGIVTVSTVFLSEYLGPKWRSIIGYRLGWLTGVIFMAVAGYFVRDWRNLSLAIGLWTLPMYPIAIVFLPESARWLMQKQRFEEAEKWIKRMAKLNKKPCPDLSVLERIAEYEDERRQHRQKYTYLDLFYSKKLAVQSVSVMFGSFSVAMIAYGIASQLSSLTGVIYYNIIIMNAVTILTLWISILTIERLGRRKSFPLFMGLNFLCMATVFTLDILKVCESRLPQTVITLMTSCFTSGAWGVVLLYAIELYPTLMRNVSNGAGNVAGKLGSILAPQITLLEHYHLAGPYAIYGAIALLSSIVLYTTLPETKGRPLPEDFPAEKRRKSKHDEGNISPPFNAMEDGNERNIALINAKENTQFEERTTFEDVLKAVGETGPFQWLVFLGFCVLDAVGSPILLFFYLDGANPGWNCPGNVDNLTSFDVVNFTVNQTVQPSLLKGLCYQGKPCADFIFNNDYTSALTEWTLICDRSIISKSITSIFFIGVVIGSLLTGQMSDLFGRKRAIVVVWALAMIGQTSSSFSPDWGVYVALRFVTGFAAGGIVTVSTVFLSEYLGPKWRSVIGYRLGWLTGVIFMAVAGYFVRDWRKLSLVIGLWTLPMYPFAVVFLPESARWLMQKQRFEEAEKWIKRMAKLNKRPCPDLSVLERIAEYEDEQRQHRQKYTYLDLFYSRKLAVQSVSVMFGSFSIALIAYGIGSQLSSLTGVIYYNIIIMNAVSILTLWISILIIEWLGRRKSFPLFMGLNCLCMATVFTLDILKVCESRLPQTVITLMTFSFTCGAWGVVLLYAVELYPTLMRNVSNGANNVAGKLGSIIAPQITLLEHYHLAGPYAIYGAIALLSSIVLYTTLPETKGRPLPEGLLTKKRRQSKPEETDLSSV